MSSGSKPRVNLRSTAVKRIMQEAAELADPDEDGFVAGPLESDIFEWHCTLRGVPGSEFEGGMSRLKAAQTSADSQGLYHLRILLPATYPMSAPDIMLMTPNGRFELGKKICIDGLTSFHAGSWQPAWGVRTAILGLRSFWTQTGADALAAIGALDYSKEERRRLARLSHEWECPTCGVKNRDLLKPETGKKAPAAEAGKNAAASNDEEQACSSTSATLAAESNAPDHRDPAMPALGAVAHSQGTGESLPNEETGRSGPSNTQTTADDSRSSARMPSDMDYSDSTAVAGPADSPHGDDVESSRPNHVPAGSPAASPSNTSDDFRQRRPHTSSSVSVQAPAAGTAAAPLPARAPASVPVGTGASAAQDLVSPDLSSRRKSLLWIDIGIFVLSSLLFVFIARRMARSGPLDDLEQA